MRSAGRKRPRVVIDANLVVSGLLLKHGVPHDLLTAWRRGSFILLISSALQQEYEAVLRRPRFAQKYGLTPEEIDAFLEVLVELASVVKPLKRLPLVVRDPKDEHVLADALGGKADYLVTGDMDLLVLAKDPRLKGLKIVQAREFLRALSEESE